MKPAALLLAFLCCSLFSFSQPGKRKAAIKTPAKPGRYLDSSFVVTKTPTVQTQTNAKTSKTPQRVNNTKLDDLKNPFDTLKTAQPRTVAAPKSTARMKKPVNQGRMPWEDSLKVKNITPAVIQKKN